jgi:ribonuclease HII
MTNHLYEYESKLIEQGFKLIAGIDEAGRGCLAGPVVAAAVVFPVGVNLPMINDSKKLTANQRTSLVSLINEHAIAIGIGVIEADIIDQVNISNAAKLAMYQALDNLSIKPDYVLIDYVKLNLDNYLAITKGDQLSVSIAAASIIAKTYRDQLMLKFDQDYPQYQFSKHKGYGTKLHLQALKEYGVCQLHRKSFSPVTAVLK